MAIKAFNTYDPKPGGLEGNEIFIFASTTETYNCTLNEISNYIKTHWGAASGTNSGYLSSTDWTTFNNKLSSFTESDPIFTAWLYTTPPAYPDDIPTALSELSEDATHRLVTDTEKNTWNAKQNALVSGTNIKTVNNTTLLGSGNLLIGYAGPTSTPVLTDNGSGNGTISSITCNVYSTTDGTGELKNYTIPSNSFTFTDGIESYVVADYNSGTPIYRVETNKLLINSFSIVTVMIIWRVGNTLHERDASAFATALPEKLNKSIINTTPYRRSVDGGLILSETSTPNPRTLLVSQAYVYAGAAAENVLTYNSSVDSLVEVTVTTGTYTFTSGKLVYDNIYYNPPSGPVALDNNKWGNIFVYRSIGDIKEVFYLFGVAQYNSSELALQEAKPAPTALPPVLKSHCMYIGRLVRQKSASSGIIRSAFDVESEYSSFDLANTIHNATVVTSIDDASEFGLWDNLTGLLRKITWTNVKVTLKTYFDGIYATISNLLSFKKYHGVESIGTITFDNSAHTITVSTITYWYKGTSYTGTSIVCDLDLTADRDNSSNTLATNKLYYFYFKDSTGKLYWSDSSWNFKENVFVCTVFWNGSAGAVQNEYHNHTRNIDWHLWAHDTIGLRYESGSALTYPTSGSPTSLQIETGTYHDEDIDFATGQITTMRGFYRVSASVYTFADYSLPYLGTSGQPQYLDTDTWTLTNVGASDYVNYWGYISHDRDRKLYIIPTHAATAYNTLTAARAGSSPTTIGLNINADFKLIYRWIYKGDGTFIESYDYRSSSPVPGGGTGAITAGAVSLVPTGNISSTNVQSAITELDTEKSNLDWITSGHTSGQTTERVAGFDTAGAAKLFETVLSTMTDGDFTGAYAGLATESNWTNNICSSISGTLGDQRSGTFGYGGYGFCKYTQSGWMRTFVKPYITNATVIAALETSANWTKITDTIYTYAASYGDVGMKYYNNGFFYECMEGSTHLWKRTGNLDTILVTDATYIPKPQVEVGKGIGDMITIPAKYDILSIVAEAETTTAGNITIGRTATAEVSNLVVTAACSTNGNCQVVLDGVTFNVALTTSMNTATLVATAIRAASFVSGSQIWTTGGTGTTVTFTSNKYKTATDATYSDNGTGATGTMTTTTQGVNPNNDVVESTALATVIGTKKNLTAIGSVDYPQSTAQYLYINIDSAATVKLHFILQKLFE